MVAPAVRMDKLLFWLGIGAGQKAAGSKEEPRDRRHRLISIMGGILIALLISAGVFILLVSQQRGLCKAVRLRVSPLL